MNVPAVLARVYRFRIVKFALDTAVKVLALVVLLKVVSGLLAWLLGWWGALPFDLFWQLLASAQRFAEALDALAAAIGAFFGEWSLGTLWLALQSIVEAVWTGAVMAALAGLAALIVYVADRAVAAAAAAWRQLRP